MPTQTAVKQRKALGYFLASLSGLLLPWLGILAWDYTSQLPSNSLARTLVLVILVFALACMFLVCHAIRSLIRTFCDGQMPPASIIIFLAHGALLLSGYVISRLLFGLRLPWQSMLGIIIGYVGYISGAIFLGRELINGSRFQVIESSPFCKAAYLVFGWFIAIGVIIISIFAVQRNRIGIVEYALIVDYPVGVCIITPFCLALTITSLWLRERAGIATRALLGILLLVGGIAGIAVYDLLVHQQRSFIEVFLIQRLL